MVSVADETEPRPIGEGPKRATRSVFATLVVPWSVIGTAKVADVCPGRKSSSPLTDVKSKEVAVHGVPPQSNGASVSGLYPSPEVM